METYETHDLALAAYLALYFPIAALKGRIGDRRTFLFEKIPELESAVDGYYQRAAQVEPGDYFRSIKEVKSQVYGREETLTS